MKTSATPTDDPDRTALICDALGHPARLAALNVLRKEKKMLLSELRHAVSAGYGEIDARNLQFHLYKMQLAGIVLIARESGRDHAILLMDVVIKTKAVTPPGAAVSTQAKAKEQ